jgi:hypothetical protein
MFISEAEIAGYRINGQLLCVDCVESNEKALEDVLNNIQRDSVLTAEDTEKDPGFYFCDRCGQSMTYFPYV